MGISGTQYRNLMSEIRGMREEIGRIDRDLARDRQDLEDFKVQMESMKSEIKQLRNEILANADKIKDKVRDELAPVAKEVKAFKNEIKKKRVVKIFKNSFIDFLKEKTRKLVGNGSGGEKDGS